MSQLENPTSRITSGNDRNQRKPDFDANLNSNLVGKRNDLNNNDDKVAKAEDEDEEEEEPLYRFSQPARSVPPGMTGLDNIGNTCFMKSVVFAFTSIRAYF